MNALARFRADPSKVRVSIRKKGANWLATVSARESNASVESISAEPEIAVMDSLKLMDGVAGIDLGLDGAYEHPFGRLGLEARRDD